MSTRDSGPTSAHSTTVPTQPGSLEDAPTLLPLSSFALRLVLNIAGCVAAFLGFLWLAQGIFSDAFHAFDLYWLQMLQHIHSPTLMVVMATFTTIGGTLFLTIIVTITTIGLFYYRRWIDGAGLALTTALGGLLNLLLKDLYQRVRPDMFPSIFELTSYSFPSGHAMGSTICFGMLAYVVGRLLPSRLQRFLLGCIAALLVINISLSRVYFAVHYPTDIIGGCLAGLVWLLLMIDLVQVADRIARRRAKQKRLSHMVQ